jgi:hypothetical protein
VRYEKRIGETKNAFIWDHPHAQVNRLTGLRNNTRPRPPDQGEIGQRR